MLGHLERKIYRECSVILLCFMKIVGSIMDKDSPQKAMWAASGFVHPCDHKAGIRLGTSS